MQPGSRLGGSIALARLGDAVNFDWLGHESGQGCQGMEMPGILVK